MEIEILLTPQVWLQVRPEVRVKIAKEFGMMRSSTPRCVTERGITRVESDGFTVSDLKKLNVQSMQQWLGFETIDPKADIHALFCMCVDRLDPPVEEKQTEDVAETRPEPALTQVEVEKKAFCDVCNSKGVRHKANCSRPK